MDVTTILLIGFLLFCVGKLSIKPIKALAQYELAKGRAEKIPGEVIRVIDAGVRRFKGVEEQEFFPVYRCEINGEEKLYHSFTKYIGDGKTAVGQKVTMLYDKGLGGLWCERELPVMKKVILARFALVVVLIGLMVAVNLITGKVSLN